MKEALRLTIAQQRKALRIVRIELEAVQEVVNNASLADALMTLVRVIEILPRTV